MLKKAIYPSKGRADRYVPSDSTRRVYQHLGKKLAVFLVCCSPLGAVAEWGPSDAVATKKQAEVRREPFPDAESLGVLPAGSLVILTGEENAGFSEISVELEEGELTGWVESSVVKAEEEREQKEDRIIKVRKKRKKRKKRIDVPVDEGVLLGRKSTFSYGALLGGHFNALSIEDPEGAASGNGLSLGVSLSFILDPAFRFRPELVYSSYAGIDETDRFISFSFFDIVALGEFPINKDFFIFAGFQYSMGMGLDNLDGAISSLLLEEASEVSGLWGQLGAGYKFAVGEGSYLSLRASYKGAFMTSPVAFHVFGIQAVFEIEG